MLRHTVHRREVEASRHFYMELASVKLGYKDCILVDRVLRYSIAVRGRSVFVLPVTRPPVL
jgi:hypothetical protein